ncbi:uncharacterized protein C8R40DRAFT_1172222 [Lentinula edodes]|uniref:uncharacterized protein n=1 Tax=Lentinula edodes TaxID=5353 RepID=UPI001E8CEA92|nr:uncharacterized protein C8R40DRAFT_1172222 [Lentinula edodes]KAH7873871.1 hypothetical protein C8R40DRAFT_1172222 [Lentinula edodes]
MATSTYLTESPTHSTENSPDGKYEYVPVDTFLDKVLNATIDEHIIGKWLLFEAPRYTCLLVIMFLEYLKSLTFEVVDAGMTKLLYRPSSIGIFFSSLIKRIIRRAGVSMSTIILAIIYLKRASHDIVIGDHAKFVAERVFLGALILSAKYSTDSAIPNNHWVSAAEVFSLQDINNIVEQFLVVLNWDLSHTESDLLKAALNVYAVRIQS